MPLLCLPASSQPQLLSPALLPTPVQLMCKRLFSCSPFQLRLLPCRLSPLPLLLLCPGRQSIPSASSCAPSHTSAQPPPSCLQRLWRRLSSCPTLQLHLLSCRPSPLPSLPLCLDRQPNPHRPPCPRPRTRPHSHRPPACSASCGSASAAGSLFSWASFRTGPRLCLPSYPAAIASRFHQPSRACPCPPSRNHHLPASSTAIRRSASALLGMSAQAAQLAQSVCLVHVLTLLGGRAPTPQGYINRD